MNEHIELPALLPCPFCGDDAVRSRTMDESLWSHETVPYHKVHCTSCEIGTEYRCEGYEPTAEESWNSRAAHEQARVVGEPVATEVATLVMAAGIANQYGVLEDKAFACAERILGLASPPAPQEAQAEQGDCPNCDPSRFCKKAACNAAPVAQPATEPRPLTQGEHEVMRAAQRSSSGVVVHPGRLVTEAERAEAPKCQTCNGQGMIGGPSYYAPDEGGEPCPDCATQTTASNAGERESHARMIADFPALSLFHTKHALGPMTAPSCLCCGQLPESIAIKHAELPGIVICTKCRDAALASKPVAPPAREALSLRKDASGVVWVHFDAPDGRSAMLSLTNIVNEKLERASGFTAKVMSEALSDFSVTTPAPAGQGNIEAAAMKLAECMGYPWKEMPGHGRDVMRDHARAVLRAARGDEVNQK